MKPGEDFAKRIEAEAKPVIFKRRDLQQSAAQPGTVVHTTPEALPPPQTIRAMIREGGKRFIFEREGGRSIKVIVGYISIRYQTPMLDLDFFCEYNGNDYRLRDILPKPTSDPQYLKFEAYYDN